MRFAVIKLVVKMEVWNKKQHNTAAETNVGECTRAHLLFSTLECHMPRDTACLQLIAVNRSEPGSPFFMTSVGR